MDGRVVLDGGVVLGREVILGGEDVLEGGDVFSGAVILDGGDVLDGGVILGGGVALSDESFWIAESLRVVKLFRWFNISLFILYSSPRTYPIGLCALLQICIS